MTKRNLKYKNEVLRYFGGKADKYDLVEKQSYWQFSDEILWFKFKHFLKRLPPAFRFLDAGGGTGRWSERVLKDFSKSSGFLYDFSEGMLAVARKKFVTNKKIKIIKGDLLNLSKKDFGGERVDITFNFHNVLGFTKDPVNVVRRMVEVTKRGGLVISFVPNLYHLIYFNISLGNIKEAKNALTEGVGRFTKEMPKIHLFTPKSIKEIYQRAGLDVVELSGFPAALYPGYLETKIEGSTKTLSNLLKDRKNFNELIKIEEKLSGDTDVAARGNNLFVVGRKKKTPRKPLL